MTDPILWTIAAVAGLSGLAIASQAALTGWRGWLDIKRLEIETRRSDTTPPSTSSRIELADLKERVRKLEAIAAGVDL
ncbi:hypothetical protein [Flavisphingomonas formosensis]|uniref:hypothetical protein n=1 Tax=Flavisphingomonas formosensis TaxID=861534 RepID=UPI0012FA2D1D|nr:hypothetical protein [Sphingomonas formosensis]